MDEIWKDIKGYEGYYQISNLGNVRSLDRKVPYPNYEKSIEGRIIAQKTKKNGYKFVILQKLHQSETFYVHRLVALHFIDGYFPKADVNHKDGNKANNISENLEWCTRSENLLHSIYILGNNRRSHENLTNRKKVVQLKKDGTFVKEYSSITEAAESIGANESNIRTCMNDKHFWKTCRGYKWISSDDYHKTADKSIFVGVLNRRLVGKIVLQYSANGTLLNEFSSVREAARLANCNYSSISKCARENKGTCGGYIWRYKESQPLLTKEKYKSSIYKING